MSEFPHAPAPLAMVRIAARLNDLTKSRHGCEVSRPAVLPGRPGHPFALITGPGGGVFLCAIWPGLTSELDALPGLTAPRWPGLSETAEVLAEFVREHAAGNAIRPPAMILLVPEVKRRDLPVELSASGGTLRIYGQEWCRSASTLTGILDEVSELGLAPLLSPDEIACWRAAVVPETKIAPLFSRAKSRGPLPTAQEAPLLLDYDQERCARLDLDPGEEGQAVLREMGVRVVTGVAGCGKTLVLVHRAALLARHFPQARLLIVTHNRALIADMRERGGRLGIGHRVEWLTFNQWLGKSWPFAGGDTIPPRERESWLEQQKAAPAFASLTKITTNYLVEEFDWMLDRGLGEDEAAYLAEPRTGRGLPLRDEQRRAIFLLLTHYLKFLNRTGLSDWSERAFRAWRSPGPLASRPLYDHILVDEAQFFAPVWFDLLRRSLHPRTGVMFLCADPTQGFLRRRSSWAKLGFDVRGRTHRLERPYRNTRALLQFAQTFYGRRLPDDDEPLNLPSPEWLGTLDQGPAPEIVRLKSNQDHLSALENNLRTLRDAGRPLGDVLILVAGQHLKAEAIVLRLQQLLGTGSAVSLKHAKTHAERREAAGVCHVMAATGLERPVVFLLGADDLFDTEDDPRLSPEEKREKIRDHTRLIYVALTRAMERLVIFTREQDRWIRCEEAAHLAATPA